MPLGDLFLFSFLRDPNMDSTRKCPWVALQILHRLGKNRLRFMHATERFHVRDHSARRWRSPMYAILFLSSLSYSSYSWIFTHICSHSFPSALYLLMDLHACLQPIPIELQRCACMSECGSQWMKTPIYIHLHYSTFMHILFWDFLCLCTDLHSAFWRGKVKHVLVKEAVEGWPSACSLKTKDAILSVGRRKRGPPLLPMQNHPRFSI